MAADDYLRGLLKTHAVDIPSAQAAGQVLAPVIENWSNKHLVSAEFSGSMAKGTGVSLSTDADIFISLTSTTGGTLKEIYDTLANAVSAAGYPARKQDVSIGTTVTGHSIDLVPGRRLSQYGNEHSLYRNRTGTWTKTDVRAHIAFVSNSGRTEEIRILKLWRTRHGLRLPSFLLELATIDALSYARHGQLSDNVWRVLQYFRDSLGSTRLIDPSNTNNVVSDDCSRTEKDAISQMANESLGKKTWNEIVW